MTEEQIRQIAAAWGLAVLKRVTTGAPAGHFATFELWGTPEAIASAWRALEPHDRGFDSLRHCDNPEHPKYRQPYIELQSVWCESAQQAMPRPPAPPRL